MTDTIVTDSSLNKSSIFPSINENKNIISDRIYKLEKNQREIYNNYYEIFNVNMGEVLKSVEYESSIARELRSIYKIYRDDFNIQTDVFKKLSLIINSFRTISEEEFARHHLELKKMISKLNSNSHDAIKSITYDGEFKEQLIENATGLLSSTSEISDKLAKAVTDISSLYHLHLCEKRTNNTISAVTSTIPDSSGVLHAIINNKQEYVIDEYDEELEDEDFLNRDIDFIFDSLDELAESIKETRCIYNEWDEIIDKIFEDANCSSEVIKNYRVMYDSIRDTFDGYLDIRKAMPSVLFSFIDTLSDDNKADSKGDKLKLENMLLLQKSKTSNFLDELGYKGKYREEFKNKTNELFSSIYKIKNKTDEIVSNTSSFYDSYIVPHLWNNTISSITPLFFDNISFIPAMLTKKLGSTSEPIFKSAEKLADGVEPVLDAEVNNMIEVRNSSGLIVESVEILADGTGPVLYEAVDSIIEMTSCFGTEAEMAMDAQDQQVPANSQWPMMTICKSTNYVV